MKSSFSFISQFSSEIKVTKDGPKIVELGARLGGDNITTHLVPLSTGVDMVECCIKIALGEMPKIGMKISKGSAIRYFESSSGTIKDIIGVADAELIPGVKQISFVHNIGDHVSTIQSSGDRIGFVISQGKDAKDAISICEEAKKCINIIIEGNE